MLTPGRGGGRRSWGDGLYTELEHAKHRIVIAFLCLSVSWMLHSLLLFVNVSVQWFHKGTSISWANFLFTMEVQEFSIPSTVELNLTNLFFKEFLNMMNDTLQLSQSYSIKMYGTELRYCWVQKGTKTTCIKIHTASTNNSDTTLLLVSGQLRLHVTTDIRYLDIMNSSL